jgi:hypothetical protein
MVGYGKNNNEKIYYRFWNGSSWTAEKNISSPTDITSQIKWITLASNPSSNHIVMGALTTDRTIWVNIWNGTIWENSQLVTTDASGSNFPNIAVAYESQAGEVLITYGKSGNNSVLYRTWNNTNSWTNEKIGPYLNNVPNSMFLDADPSSNVIMLSVQDSDKDLNYVLWDGSVWELPNELETDTGEVKNQPFLFLWKP